MPFALAIHNTIKALLESWAHSKHRALTFTKMFLSNTLRLQLYCRYSVYSINIMWGTRKIKKHKQKGINYCLFSFVGLNIYIQYTVAPKVFGYFWTLESRVKMPLHDNANALNLYTKYYPSGIWKHIMLELSELMALFWAVCEQFSRWFLQDVWSQFII